MRPQTKYQHSASHNVSPRSRIGRPMPGNPSRYSSAVRGYPVHHPSAPWSWRMVRGFLRVHNATMIVYCCIRLSRGGFTRLGEVRSSREEDS